MILGFQVLFLSPLPAQKDRVKYVPAYDDPVLKQMKTTRDSLKAIEDSLTETIRTQQKKNNKDQEDYERTLRFDYTGVTKPTSPKVFKAAFHLPPVAQYNTGTCWAFAGTSLVEAEVARLQGLKIKLSEMYMVYYEYLEKCRYFVQQRGAFHLSQGSEPNTVFRLIKFYGIVPHDLYPGYAGDEKYDHSCLSHEIRTYLQYIKDNDFWDEALVIATVKLILNKYMGEPPATFIYEERTMTPIIFAREILNFNPDDYAGVISTYTLPFYTRGELEVDDNWWHDSTYYNLPLDIWFDLLKQGLEDGFTAVLGGDVSEPGYNGFEDAAVIPDFDIPQAYINQDSREYRIYNRSTGDDHSIHAVGTKKIKGHDWFLIKDSSRSGRWGKYEGYYFYRDDYVRLKMLFYLVPKDVLKSVLNKFE